MTQPNKRIEIVVLGFPSSEPLIKQTTIQLQEATEFLKSSCRLDLDFKITDSYAFNPRYHETVLRFLEICSRQCGYLNVQWFAVFNGITGCAYEGVLADFMPIIDDARKVAEPFFRQLLEIPPCPPPKALFVAARGFKLIGPGCWGNNQGTYPRGISIERSGHKQSLFHEFFHLFGATEGYLKTTKETKRGCEKCWMQWNATKGSGLCRKHLNQIKQFLENLP